MCFGAAQALQDAINRFYRDLTMARFALSESPNREAITMARIAPEKSNFFVRCNYDVGAPGEAHKATVRQEQDLKGAAQGALGRAGQVIAKIEQGHEGEAALRELRASLLEIRALRAREPGIRTACQDLYEAAAAWYWTTAPEWLWWISGGGGCLTTLTCAYAAGSKTELPALAWGVHSSSA